MPGERGTGRAPMMWATAVALAVVLGACAAGTKLRVSEAAGEGDRLPSCQTLPRFAPPERFIMDAPSCVPGFAGAPGDFVRRVHGTRLQHPMM
jgi:hypothetical protein